MKYLLVVQFISTAVKQAVTPVQSSKEEAEALVPAFLQQQRLDVDKVKFFVLSGPDEVAVDEAYKNLVNGRPVSYSTLTPEETRRLQFETGPGGDHDQPYERQMPTKLNEIAAWGRLTAKVYRGELGGENDGNE